MKLLDVSNKPFHTMVYRSSGKGGTVREVTLPFMQLKVSGLPSGVSFAVTSDIQGRELNNNNRLVGEAVAEELALLVECGEISKPDFILLAGDLYDYPDLRKLGGTGDVTTVWNAFSRVCDQVVGVHGNHDIVDISSLAGNTMVLNGDTTTVARSIKIAGIGGIVGKEGKNQRKSQAVFKNELSSSLANQPDIVVLHQGPDYPEDDEPGESFIREYLASRGSGLVFFGHCHWNKVHLRLGNNDVFNVANRVLLVTS